jgi:hypothetical protein
MSENLYARLAETLSGIDTPRALGRVTSARGIDVEIEGLSLPLGGAAFIRRSDGTFVEGEVMSVSMNGARLKLLESAEGVVVGASVEFGGRSPVARLSRSLLGRAIDALGRPADGLGGFPGAVPAQLARSSALNLRARRTLVRGGTWKDRVGILAEAANEHEGPVVALLVGGASASHRRFAEMLDSSSARTARVVEPGRVSRVRAWRAARVAGTLARMLSESEGRAALVVVDWRAPVTTPMGLALHGASESLWSLGREARACDDDFDLVIDVAAKREVA